jgi:hypothetical protein
VQFVAGRRERRPELAGDLGDVDEVCGRGHEEGTNGAGAAPAGSGAGGVTGRQRTARRLP